MSSLQRPELFPGTGPTLELLAAAGRDVAAWLELGRPGSSRSPPGAQEASEATESCECGRRESGATAGGSEGGCAGMRAEAWSAQGPEGSLGAREVLAQPASPPSQAPGLASVPRGHRRLRPPAPAPVGPEAGGAVGLRPEALRSFAPLAQAGL